MQVKARDLKLGDVVKTMDGPYGTSTVCRVTDTEVEFFRPYAVTSGFSYGAEDSRTLCYTGVEQWALPRDDRTFERYRSEQLR